MLSAFPAWLSFRCTAVRMCLVGAQAVWGEDGEKTITGTLITADEFKELFKLDDWNDVVIIARGNPIRHYLNC